MAFKFTILLLFIVIAENSLSQATNEEVISDAFNFAFEYYGGVSGFVKTMWLRRIEFLDFVGKSYSLQYVNEYWAIKDKLEEQVQFTRLEDFSYLVTFICEKQEIPIVDFLTKRIAEAKLLNKAMNAANGYFTCEPPRKCRSVRLSEFLSFVGKYNNKKYLNNYWTEKSAQPKAQDDKIYIIEFRDLVYWICRKNNYDVKDFLEKKIAIVEAIDRSFSSSVDYYKNYCPTKAYRQSHPDNYPQNGIRHIRESELLDFVGEHNRKVYLQCVNDYRAKNPVTPENRDVIRIEDFKEIMYMICSRQKFDLKDFLENRTAAAEVIKEAFDYVYNSKDHEPNQGRTILLSDFLKFVNKDNNDYYGAAASVLQLRDYELCMKEFKETLYLVFSNEEFVLKDFLEKRIAVAEIMKKAFDSACDHFDVGDRKSLRESEFFDFLDYAYGFWPENLDSLSKRDNINFERFAKLVNWICSKQRINIIDFLEKRIADAENIKNAYDFVHGRYDIVQGECFGLTEFLDFVGDDANSQIVNEYWASKSVLPENRDKITVEHFLGLFYLTCSKKGYDPTEFIKERMEKSVANHRPAV